ncbi:hypothetical protein M407DRAFT_244197 [Tulasnella calospora MUT 4182]|uniref:Uncharacterized protein n=1 Tax=Tulasnella calospora MUT 4182 TaxID=1051891 RepID=A0A0C3QFY2_9AGAM|nr:hypothetical protein M407DRAFT_244197 [Tulasnella calospora MUT 4182]
MYRSNVLRNVIGPMNIPELNASLSGVGCLTQYAGNGSICTRTGVSRVCSRCNAEFIELWAVRRWDKRSIGPFQSNRACTESPAETARRI